MAHMDEVAEFIGGEVDGRTLRVADPAPHILRVPVRSPSYPLVQMEDESPTGMAPTFTVDDYELMGRNDAGHLRYMKRRSPVRGKA